MNCKKISKYFDDCFNEGFVRTAGEMCKYAEKMFAILAKKGLNFEINRDIMIQQIKSWRCI